MTSINLDAKFAKPAIIPHNHHKAVKIGETITIDIAYRCDKCNVMDTKQVISIWRPTKAWANHMKDLMKKHGVEVVENGN